MPMEYGRRQVSGVVVAIECVAGGSRAEEWGPGSSETVQTGDVVEELCIGVGGRGGATLHAAPFKGGRVALQKHLHAAYKRGDTSVEVRVRRPAQGGELLVAPPPAEEAAAAATTARMQACIVPKESSVGGGGMGMGMVGRSRHYVLRSIRDPNYAVGLVDRMESECVAYRGHRPALPATRIKADRPLCAAGSEPGHRGASSRSAGARGAKAPSRAGPPAPQAPALR